MTPTECVRCSTLTDDLTKHSWCQRCRGLWLAGCKTIPRFYLEHKFKHDPRIKFRERPFVTFVGAAGVGKTLEAVKLLKEESEQRKLLPHFQNCAEFFLLIRASFDKQNPMTEIQLVKSMQQKEMLLLDDFAAEAVAAYSLASIYLILNHRGERYKPTIITSNLSINGISQLDERLANRLVRYGEVYPL